MMVWAEVDTVDQLNHRSRQLEVVMKELDRLLEVVDLAAGRLPPSEEVK